MLTVTDDYFENPYEIRKYALSQTYYPFFGGDRGFRYNFKCKNSIEKLIRRQIRATIREKTDLKEFGLLVDFHLSPEFVMKSLDFRNKYHIDGTDGYAGVIYLHPDPPEYTGTCFSGGKCVKNKFNRMVLYPKNVTHAPNQLFGSVKEDSRMTITFFTDF